MTTPKQHNTANTASSLFGSFGSLFGSNPPVSSPLFIVTGSKCTIPTAFSAPSYLADSIATNAKFVDIFNKDLQLFWKLTYHRTVRMQITPTEYATCLSGWATDFGKLLQKIYNAKYNNFIDTANDNLVLSKNEIYTPANHIYNNNHSGGYFKSLVIKGTSVFNNVASSVQKNLTYRRNLSNKIIAK